MRKMKRTFVPGKFSFVYWTDILHGVSSIMVAQSNEYRHKACCLYTTGRLKTREWKTWERQKCRGGNRGRNEYGEQKFTFFNIVGLVDSSIGLVYPSGLQQPIELCRRSANLHNHSVARQCLHCCKIDQPVLWR